jgi:hypothetical protein
MTQFDPRIALRSAPRLITGGTAEKKSGIFESPLSVHGNSAGRTLFNGD